MEPNDSAAWSIGHIHLWLRRHRTHQPSDGIVKPLIADHLACPHTAISLPRDARGRPFLHCPYDGWDANWSHSGDYLLLGLAQGGRIGVDIEQQRPRQRCLQLAERFFHPAEAAVLRQTPVSGQLDLFLRLWCAKEAVLKANGYGVGFGLHRVKFTPSASGLRLTACDPSLGQPWHWQLREWMPLPGYQAAFAYLPNQASASPPAPNAT